MKALIYFIILIVEVLVDLIVQLQMWHLCEGENAYVYYI